MKLTALSFRWILLAILVAILVVGAVGFYFTLSQLRQFSSETAALNLESSQADSKAASLRSDKTFIEDHSVAVDKAKQITSSQEKFAYQDAIIQNIRNLASESGLTVNKIEFPDTASPENDSSTPAQPSDQTGPTLSLPGFTTKKATVNFSPKGGKDTISYQDLLNFMYKIENNTLKMYIESMSLNSVSTGARAIQTPTLIITIFVKQ